MHFKSSIIPKSVFGTGKELTYNDHKLVFPSKLEEFYKIVYDKELIKDLDKKKYLKDNSPKYYRNLYVDNISQEFIDGIEYKYRACYLNYFDMDEYQLSVLRYDNVHNKYLTNKEILKQYKNLKK